MEDTIQFEANLHLWLCLNQFSILLCCRCYASCTVDIAFSTQSCGKPVESPCGTSSQL